MKSRRFAFARSRRSSARRVTASAADLVGRQQKIEKSADDFEAIRKSVEDAAAVGTGIWLSYLFVLFYLSVAVGAVTHADLLLENPVKLPFLNIELPLLAFFALSPILLIIVHAYTLVHFALLGRKATRFHEALYVMFPDKGRGEVSDQADTYNSTIREGLRRQLPSNIFVQILAGPSDIRKQTFGRLLRVISIFSLALGPVATLLLFQIQFLPYHDWVISWLHRCAIVVDLVMILWLWPMMVEHPDNQLKKRRFLYVGVHLRSAVLFAIVVAFSFFIATFPGERVDRVIPRLPLRGLFRSPFVTGEMFEKPSTASADLMTHVSSKKCALNAFLTDRDKSEMQYIVNRANKRTP